MTVHGFASEEVFVHRDAQPQAAFPSGASRRAFLKVLAAAGVGAVLPVSGLIAQTAPPANRANPRRIDVHHHINPPSYSQLSPITRRWNWTPERSIEQMDKYGIATSITSITQPGVWFGDVQQGRALSRACNDYGAQMVRDFPGRFGLFASLPLPDQEGTLREIEYAYDVLKADGVILLTSYGKQWLGDAAFRPAFEELNRRKAVIFCHVYVSDCCRSLFPGSSPTRAEYDFDTTRTVESLLMSGTLGRVPEIRFIFVPSGGTLPVLAGRINDRVPADRTDLAPKGVMYELKKFYYEVAHGTYAAPLAALTRFVPASQILFGTDYPAEPIETTTKPLAEFGLSAKDLQAIDRGNAERLFPRLKG